jgi:hypothetical protein
MTLRDFAIITKWLYENDNNFETKLDWRKAFTKVLENLIEWPKVAGSTEPTVGEKVEPKKE